MPRFITILGVFVGGIILVASHGSKSSISKPTSVENPRLADEGLAVRPPSRTLAHSEPLTEDMLRMVCRATISTLMGRDVNIIKSQMREGIVYLNYIRPDDGVEWFFRCKAETPGSNRIVWASHWETKKNSSYGRWRTGPQDGVIVYEINELSLAIHINFEDGSTMSESFQLPRGVQDAQVSRY